MNYHLTLKSSNAKTGPIPVTTTSSDSCPDSCPFINKACYAKSGPLALHWRQVTLGNRGLSLNALCAEIAALPPGQLWRHNQAGDLPGINKRIDNTALQALVSANHGRNGFTYTHKPATRENIRAIKAANKAGFTINLSGNNPAHADELLRHGLPVVTVLPIDAPKVSYTPNGAKIVVCPAINSDKVTCASCGLCQKQDRDYVIGFTAHGTGKKRANAIALNIAN